MSVRRGDVVRVDWPYSDRTGSKVRPAIVVQDKALNALIADTILVLISRTQRALGITEVELDPADEANSGLRFRSVASCANLLTVDQGLITATMGNLSHVAMQAIDRALRAALGLP